MENKICKKCKGVGKYETKPIIFGIGAMGYHFPASVGMALAKKIKKEEGTVYCLISDGECQIGSTWESALIAAQKKLNNLILIIDRNNLQAMGAMKDILDIEPLIDKLKSFNWEVRIVDGHNHEEIKEALTLPRRDSPVVIIANTIKGYPISFMKGDNTWHYSHVNQEVLDKAMEELNNEK